MIDVALAAAWLLVGAAPAESEELPSFRIETLDGRAFVGVLDQIVGEALRLETERGMVQLESSELLLMTPVPPASTETSEPAPEPSPESSEEQPPRDLLVLAARETGAATGDRLWGRLVGGDDYGVRFRFEAGLVVEIPFDHVDRLLPRVDRPIDRLLALEVDGFDDRIWRRREDGSLDAVTGVVNRVDAGTVVLESALGELSFALDEVLAVALAETEHAGGDIPGWPARVRLVDGSLFEAGLLSAWRGALEFATQFGERLAIPVASIASVVWLVDGRASLLTELHPLSVEEWPSIGAAEDFLFPWRRNLSVSGRPLRLGGVLRATGVGVHANARLIYAVPSDARVLRVTAGLVDEVEELPAEGTVRFEIRVDGEPVAGTDVVREGDAPVVLRVDDLRGAREIELLTLDAGDYDAADRAGWVDGVFLADGE